MILLVLGLFYSATFAFGANDATPISTEKNPKISFEPTEFDAGDISMADGKYIKNYKLTNDGQLDLVISAITTSCMCTDAVLKVDGRTSPEFGMHGYNGPTWSETISPGQSGELKVIFDPLAHGPDATGPIERFITIISNDPDNPTSRVKFSGNVIKGSTSNNDTSNTVFQWFIYIVIAAIIVYIVKVNFLKKNE
ncbi:MAG: hypothetical protein COU81_01705 [Candidatus Portnoybacteria bacterium CG10_big_fil_rev_8_21_14_0_10_36_7]|uniref:DUF1573 domain-containing protein n=1 Tax=Candidatus Portnoybacteria bacterium CG10_big_fil_rev_8_21_14_0_10_36_7 TaxID=1974812 RepID=A0A2M8KE99_9BACT|nr:MAG: hypothetical protein COU81_01705 [Candidatus Portnoybacteria bacterium CG10_big_fil_rev_8_21_14_0_10_36_7]